MDGVMCSVTAAELKEIEDDRDWWKRACATFNARLIGWTYRRKATVSFEHDAIELDGRVAKAINRSLSRNSRNHERRSALIAARNELLRLDDSHAELDPKVIEKLNKAIRYEDDRG